MPQTEIKKLQTVKVLLEVNDRKVAWVSGCVFPPCMDNKKNLCYIEISKAYFFYFLFSIVDDTDKTPRT